MYFIISGVIGGFIGVLVAVFFPEQVKNKIYFFKKNLALILYKPNISLNLFSRVTLAKRENMDGFLERVLSQTRQSYKPEKGISSVRLPAERKSCAIKGEISPLLDSECEEGLTVYAFNIYASTEDARYKILGDNLTDIFAEHSKMRELLLQGFPDATSRLGKATLEVRLNKPPTVLAYLHKLDITSLDTQKDSLRISFTDNTVRIVGAVGSEIANSVKEIITWYY